MKKIISEIINQEFGFEVDSIDEIINLGLVNRVFDVKANGLHLIVRINEDSGKEYEFWKEKWCI